MKTPSEIREILAGCTGSQTWFRHQLSPILYTEGVQALCEAADCYWLMDAIASYQWDKPMLRACDGTQFWKLKVDLQTRTAMLICIADSGMPVLIAQVIEHTDFPLEEVSLWVEGQGPDRVLLLPSEH